MAPINQMPNVSSTNFPSPVRDSAVNPRQAGSLKLEKISVIIANTIIIASISRPKSIAGTAEPIKIAKSLFNVVSLILFKTASLLAKII